MKMKRKIKISRNLDPVTSTVYAFPGMRSAYNIVGTFIKVVRNVSDNVDRFIFIPTTAIEGNDDTKVIASLLYLDFISSLEARKFLTTGFEGINYEVNDDGAIVGLDALNTEWAMNSLRNCDYTLTLNTDGAGPSVGDPVVEGLSAALSFEHVDPFYVARTYELNQNPEINRVMKVINVGTIEAEEGVKGDLNTKRNNMFIEAIMASPDQFDAVYDAGLQNLMNSGLAAVIAERTEKWEYYYGDAVNIE